MKLENDLTILPDEVEPEIYCRFEDLRKYRRIAERYLKDGYYFDTSKFTFGELLVFQRIVEKISLEDLCWLSAMAARQKLRLFSGYKDLKISPALMPGLGCTGSWSIDPDLVDRALPVGEMIFPFEEIDGTRQ
jgi:hypothetical protein